MKRNGNQRARTRVFHQHQTLFCWFFSFLRFPLSCVAFFAARCRCFFLLLLVTILVERLAPFNTIRIYFFENFCYCLCSRTAHWNNGTIHKRIAEKIWLVNGVDDDASVKLCTLAFNHLVDIVLPVAVCYHQSRFQERNTWTKNLLFLFFKHTDSPLDSFIPIRGGNQRFFPFTLFHSVAYAVACCGVSMRRLNSHLVSRWPISCVMILSNTFHFPIIQQL